MDVPNAQLTEYTNTSKPTMLLAVVGNAAAEAEVADEDDDLCKVSMGHLTIEISVGDLTKETTDAIVNSTDQALSHTGANCYLLQMCALKLG